MTPTSLLPKIAQAAGVDYATLCESILEGAALHGALGVEKRTSRISRVALTEKAEAAPRSSRTRTAAKQRRVG